MRNNYIHIMLFVGVFVVLGNTMSVHATVNLDINPSKKYQTVDGIGGGIVYYLDWLTTHKNKPLLYDTLFNGLGLSALRIGNWAQSDDADLSYEAEIVGEAKKRLGDNFYITMSSWSAPAELKANNSLSGTCGGAQKATLKRNWWGYVYDDFGKWWRRSLEKYHSVGIVPDYISIQNEVDCDADYESTVFTEVETSEYAGYPSALKSTYDNIKGMENCPGIHGPEVLGIGWNNVQKFVNKIDKSMLTGYNFHYYHSGMNDHDAIDQRYAYPDDFLGAMTQLSTDYYNDKPMYMDENSTLRGHWDKDPIYTACFLSYAFAVNHVVGYLHWNLIWGDTGDGCINLEFSEKGYETEDGFKIQGDYHAIRHFSKFIKRGWRNIQAMTDNNDKVLVSAFESPKQDAYTVVVINRTDKDEQVYINSFAPKDLQATLVMSRPLDDFYSQVIGTYSDFTQFVAPANSITTICYRKKVETFTFSVEGADDWKNIKNWTPSELPSAEDTILIKKGTAKLSHLNHSSYMKIDSAGAIQIDNAEEDIHVSELVLDNGKVISNSSDITLDSKMIVKNAPEIVVTRGDGVLSLTGMFLGDGDIVKKGDGELVLKCGASLCSGYAMLQGGTLTLTQPDAIPAQGIYADYGVLKIDTSVVTPFLSVGYGAKVQLNHTIVVKNAVLGDISLGAGKFTSEHYPQFLQGDDTLVVDQEEPILVKEGEGESQQNIVLDSMLVPFHYSWENADSVKVTFDPYQPNGLICNVDNDKKLVSFEGEVKEVGVFKFTITTLSNAATEAKKSGVLSVSAPQTSGVRPILQNYFDRLFMVEASKDGLVIECEKGEKNRCHFLLVDMEGKVLSDFMADVPSEHWKVEKKLSLEVGVYLLQIRSSKGLRSVKVIVK